jgi:hypothetical protein
MEEQQGLLGKYRAESDTRAPRRDAAEERFAALCDEWQRFVDPDRRSSIGEVHEKVSSSC